MAFITTIYERTGIKQLVILLVASAMLISCGDMNPDPVCVGSDDLGNTINKNTKIESNRSGADSLGWIDSGLEVLQNNRLSIRSIGEMDLCIDNPVIVATNTFSPSSTNPSWQDAGIVISKNYKYKIEITGAYTLWGSPQTGCTGRYIDSDCWLRNGKGLFAFIGNSNPADAWFGDEKQDDTDHMFEMYRRDATANPLLTNNVGYASNFMKEEGKLWLRYRDVHGANQNQQDSWNGKPLGWYADNRGPSPSSWVSGGGYTVTVKRYGPCHGSNGKYTGASIGATGASGTPINLNACSVVNTSVTGGGAANVCANGMFSTTNAPASGKVWLRLVDPDNNYAAYNNNSGSNYGSYSVSLTTDKITDAKFSNLVTAAIDPVRNILLGDRNAIPPTKGLTQTMYENITANGEYVQGVRALMVLSVTLFAFMFMAGLSNVTQKELIVYTIKMGIVITMISPGSWDFFSRFLFSFFIEGTDNLIWIMSSSINELVSGAGSPLMQGAADNSGASQSSSVFGFLNTTLAIIFSKEANIKLQALMLTFPIGPFLAIAMWMGMFYFLFALIKAILAYLIAIIMTALLIFLAPIFICFILFNWTKPIFDKWVRQLVAFALQPIMLFMVLAIFNIFIVLSLYNVLNFNACYSCLWEMDLPLSEGIQESLSYAASKVAMRDVEVPIDDFDKFCPVYAYLPWGMDASQDAATKLAKMPIGLLYVMIFVIMANIMLKFIDWVVQLANSLTGGGAAVSGNVSSAAGAVMSQAMSMTKTAGGMGIDTAKFAGRNAIAPVLKATVNTVGFVATGGKNTNVIRSGKDSAIKSMRRSLPRFLTKGGKDASGRHVAFSSRFRTSEEDKGYNRDMDRFNSLDKKDQQAERAQNVMTRDLQKLDQEDFMKAKDAPFKAQADQMKAEVQKKADSAFGTGGNIFKRAGRAVAKSMYKGALTAQKNLSSEGRNLSSKRSVAASMASKEAELFRGQRRGEEMKDLAGLGRAKKKEARNILDKRYDSDRRKEFSESGNAVDDRLEDLQRRMGLAGQGDKDMREFRLDKEAKEEEDKKTYENASRWEKVKSLGSEERAGLRKENVTKDALKAHEKMADRSSRDVKANQALKKASRWEKIKALSVSRKGLRGLKLSIKPDAHKILKSQEAAQAKEIKAQNRNTQTDSLGRTIYTAEVIKPGIMGKVFGSRRTIASLNPPPDK